ncbi:MAG: 50S ribosomal protein L29 [Gammaproteobacteria bacterium]|nr:MAG: 50S ribosomal protein L29 [Gammaproteobacteria bacterium]
MKASELKSKTGQELREELIALLREQFNLRMQKGINPDGIRPNQISNVRKNIARVKTVISANRQSEQS